MLRGYCITIPDLQSTNDENSIFETASSLMMGLTDALFDQGKVLRLIGVGVSGIDHGEYQQMGMDASERKAKMAVLKNENSIL